MIKAIFFDFAGVLSKEYSIVSGYFVPYYKQLTEEVLRERYRKGRDGELTFEELTEDIPQRKVFAYLEKAKLNKGAIEAIEELSRHYKLYVASNHLPGFFETEVEHLGIKSYVTGFYISYRMKTHKPLREFFEKMIQESKVNPKEAIFVDDALTNLETAGSLGMKTIWFNNKNNDKRNAIEYKPDFEVTNFRRLIEVIESIELKSENSTLEV
jgi:HAD superfamily hydrolase (TIGR01509 family)